MISAQRSAGMLKVGERLLLSHPGCLYSCEQLVDGIIMRTITPKGGSIDRSFIYHTEPIQGAQ